MTWFYFEIKPNWPGVVVAWWIGQSKGVSPFEFFIGWVVCRVMKVDCWIVGYIDPFIKLGNGGGLGESLYFNALVNSRVSQCLCGAAIATHGVLIFEFERLARYPVASVWVFAQHPAIFVALDSNSIELGPQFLGVTVVDVLCDVIW